LLSHPIGIMNDMARQLRLIDPAEHDWRLDQKTRETGKQGLAEARKALAEAARRAAAKSGAAA
jgi:hypothetical protein